MILSSVSALTEELAASMEQVASTLGQMTEGSANVLSKVDTMNASVVEGTENVNSIKARAEDMDKDARRSKDITEKKQNAVKTMLDKTDDQMINHSDFSSEKHSEAYQQANKHNSELFSCD